MRQLSSSRDATQVADIYVGCTAYVDDLIDFSNSCRIAKKDRHFCGIHQQLQFDICNDLKSTGILSLTLIVSVTDPQLLLDGNILACEPV